MTGATRGIGKEIALRLAKLGANVAVCGRDEAQLIKTGKELSCFGTKIILKNGDLTEKGFARNFVEDSAEQMGGLDIIINNAGMSFTRPFKQCTEEDIDTLRETKYGKKALALLQVGKKDRAELYLKYMITSKISDRTLHAINSIATAYGLPRVSIQASSLVKDRGILEIDDNIIYSAQYPLPDWEPMGGWSIDRALLLAITKQESGFRANAKSGAGANGLMQIMPSTAKKVAKENKVNISEIDMSNPEHNMFLGQQYIVDLLAHQNINNNIIKMLAAYNAGMGTLVEFEKNFETYDPLLYIESFPTYETRSYIKRVMSNMWLYRARLDQPLTTMKELADGEWPLYNSEDEYVQKQIADRMSI